MQEASLKGKSRVDTTVQPANSNDAIRSIAKKKDRSHYGSTSHNLTYVSVILSRRDFSKISV